MKVFLSWSGSRSKEVAQYFGEWLPHIFHSLDIFISVEIAKGLDWNKEIYENLKTCDFGLFFITKNNINSSWLNFEAGALRSLDRPIMNVLCDKTVSSADIGVLQLFQTTNLYVPEDVKRLLSSIKTICSSTIKDSVFDKLVNDNLPQLMETWGVLQKIPLAMPYKDVRPIDEKIDEMLERLQKVHKFEVENWEQQQKYLDEFDTKFETTVLRGNPYSLTPMNKAVAAGKITLPNGTQILDSCFEENCTFKTWEEYAVILGVIKNISEEEVKSRIERLRAI